MNSLKDAIDHAEGVSRECDGQCSIDHKQLAEWLGELHGFREIFGDLPDFSKLMEPPEENSQVLQVVLAAPNGTHRTLLLKDATILEDPAVPIDMATGIARPAQKRSFALAGTVIEET